jgi:hypothetical protein
LPDHQRQIIGAGSRAHRRGGYRSVKQIWAPDRPK